MTHLKRFLKHYLATLTLMLILGGMSIHPLIYLIIIPALLGYNIIFTAIGFFLNKIFRLEFFIALLVVALYFFIYIYIKRDYYTEYADKVDLDNVLPQNPLDYYIGDNYSDIQISLSILIIHTAYCLFFGKNKFYGA